ncbi:ankyrin repeat domain-containing protein [Brachyspira hampsonii]|uniref:ankyrin repeat domain-containing protein n=1 Tax=Brachyspira hampsonii TaxID=1287055 RepID=UPI000D332030|nr:ankyrin repeat domain-containing protein [Brachyspira hampsonii]PTY40331.1 ankyrin [Brachyspira hampsonii bv. II]
MKKLIFILFLFSLYLYSQTDNKTKAYERLREYVNEGNVKEAENILKQHNVNINNIDYEDFTLLSHAVMDNNIEMAELLLKYKADVNTVVNDGDTALILAVDNNNMEMVKLLLSYGADIDYQGFRGRTALFCALEYNRKENIEMVKLLIKNKADVNIAYDGDNENEETPLMYAAMKGYKETVKILIANKADINKKNSNNANALIYAYMFGHDDIADTLLQNGSDSLDKSLKVCRLNQSTLLSSNVPLINTVVYSTNEVFLQKLIDNCADVNYKTYDFRTALVEAAEYNNINAVKVLLKNNADVNVQNNGKTALMWACYNGNLEMTKMLLDAGTDKNIKNGNYDALYYAREYGKNEEIIKLLTK